MPIFFFLKYIVENEKLEGRFSFMLHISIKRTKRVEFKLLTDVETIIAFRLYRKMPLFIIFSSKKVIQKAKYAVYTVINSDYF